MPEIVTVRVAVLADAPSIAALSRALGYPVPVEILAQRLGRLLARIGEIVLVAELAPVQVLG